MNKLISNPAYFKRKIEHSFSSSRNKGDFLCSPLTCVCYHQLPTLWWGGAEEGASHTIHLRHLRPLCFQTGNAGSLGSQCRNSTASSRSLRGEACCLFDCKRIPGAQARPGLTWRVPLKGYLSCFVLIHRMDVVMWPHRRVSALVLPLILSPCFHYWGTMTFLRQTANSGGPLRFQK